MDVLESQLVKKFKCITKDCPDTCCKIWSMQVDDNSASLYKSNSDLKDIYIEENNVKVLKKDTDGYCVKFDRSDSMCGVHKSYGTEYLTDACFLYPRVRHKLSRDMVVINATLSCPEICRIALESELDNRLLSKPIYNEEFLGEVKMSTAVYNKDVHEERKQASTTKLPLEIEFRKKSNEPYIPGSKESYRLNRTNFDHNYAEIYNLESKFIIDVHKEFLDIILNEKTSIDSILSLLSISRSIKLADSKTWLSQIQSIRNVAINLMPQGKENDLYPYYLLQIILIMVKGSKKIASERLIDAITYVYEVLDVRVNQENSNIEFSKSSIGKYNTMKNSDHDEYIDNIMRKWLYAQSSIWFYPFNIPDTIPNIIDASNILAIKYVITKMFLRCAINIDSKVNPVDIIQPIARQIDHINEYSLLLEMIKSYSLNKSENIVGLLRYI